MKYLTFTQTAYDDMRETVGSQPSETGGIALGSRDDFVIQKFVLDKTGSCSAAAYDPDMQFINATIKKEWEENGLALLGFIHSHPRGVSRLSGDYGNNTGDIGYTKAILKAIPDLDRFLVPIVYSDYDGQGFKLFPYVAYRGNEENYTKAELKVIPDAEYVSQPSEAVTKPKCKKRKQKAHGLKDPSRLNGSVDVELMRSAKIVGIGVGGASNIYENLVRSGLQGRLTIIDFDKVDDSNTTTQGFNPGEVGLSKVEALEYRLMEINPQLSFEGIEDDFFNLSPEQKDKIFRDADLIMLMTDNFRAQAEGNHTALHYQIPAIYAMMYRNARASEVMFTIPNVTPACFRCAVSPRYKAYNEEGYENDIKSFGSTIFHTYYLNCVIGMLALAILHNDTKGYEFSNWFGEYFDRNFLQIRNHPDYSSGSNELFGKTYAKIPKVFNFDSVWQKIEPELPPKYDYCPDCQGLGYGVHSNDVAHQH